MLFNYGGTWYVVFTLSQLVELIFISSWEIHWIDCNSIGGSRAGYWKGYAVRIMINHLINFSIGEKLNNITPPFAFALIQAFLDLHPTPLISYQNFLAGTSKIGINLLNCCNCNRNTSGRTEPAVFCSIIVAGLPKSYIALLGRTLVLFQTNLEVCATLPLHFLIIVNRCMVSRGKNWRPWLRTSPLSLLRHHQMWFSPKN